MDYLAIFSRDNFYLFIIKSVSSLMRMLILLAMPLLFINTQEFFLYGKFYTVFISITIISGFGVPVHLIKQIGNGSMSKAQYNNILFPLHFFSSIIFYIISVLISPEISLLKTGFVVMFLFSETITTEILRQYQIYGEYKQHILFSFWKTALLGLLLLLNFIFYKKISFESFLILNLFVNVILITKNLLQRELTFINKWIKFDWNLLKISFPYFLMYIFDRYLLSFDRVFLSNYLLGQNLKLLLLITPLVQASFNIIEGSLFLKLYNEVFIGRLGIASFTKLAIWISFMSIPVSVLISIYLSYSHHMHINLIFLIFCSLLYFIFSSYAWYLNIINYSKKTPIVFLLVAIFLVTLYFSSIFLFSVFDGQNVMLLILFYPISVFLSNFLFAFRDLKFSSGQKISLE